MQKIIISTTNLNKTFWTTVYAFIESIVCNYTDMAVWLKELQSKSKVYITDYELDKDPSSVYGVMLKISNIKNCQETIFSIIYEKQDDKEDFVDLVSFFLLKKKFLDRITLGINLVKIPLEKNRRNNYIFKCSEFFRFIDDRKPKRGRSSIYFINEKTLNESTTKDTDTFFNNTTKLRGKGSKYNNKTDKEILHVSRRYLPLFKINKENYTELFGSNKCNVTSKEAIYLSNVIVKISADISPFTNHTNYASIFEEWMVKAFFHSLNANNKYHSNDECGKIITLLRSYYNNIYELVQNIIFHTKSKQGLMYFIFNHKKDISNNQSANIIDFKNYPEEQRFIEIGIIDFNEKGIAENFALNQGESGEFKFKDFFDKSFIKTTFLCHIDLRYMAHLGIKTFVKSIIRHKGYFRVESNNAEGGKEIVSLHNMEVVSLPSTKFVDGTHYEIILPVNTIDQQVTPSSNLQVQKGSFAEKLKHRIKDNVPNIKSISVRLQAKVYRCKFTVLDLFVQKKW